MQQLKSSALELPQELINRNELLTRLGLVLIKVDYEDAMHWLEDVHSSFIDTTVKSTVLAKWSQEVPERALTYLKNNNVLAEDEEKIMAVHAAYSLDRATASAELYELYNYN